VAYFFRPRKFLPASSDESALTIRKVVAGGALTKLKVLRKSAGLTQIQLSIKDPSRLVNRSNDPGARFKKINRRFWDNISDSGEFLDQAINVLFTSHAAFTANQLETCPKDSRVEVLYQQLRDLTQQCVKLQRKAFERFIQFLPSENMLRSEIRSNLLFANEWALSHFAEAINDWLPLAIPNESRITISSTGGITFIWELERAYPVWLQDMPIKLLPWELSLKQDFRVCEQRWFTELPNGFCLFADRGHEKRSEHRERLSIESTRKISMELRQVLELSLESESYKIVEEYLPRQSMFPQVAAGGSSLPVSFRHSNDYRSIVFNGEHHALTPNQATIVRILHEALERGTPSLGKATLLDAIESETSRLQDSFRKSELWGTLVVSDRRGTYRLNLILPGNRG
jgi:hypothetical protein